ncbi:MAG: fibronectin type III domain-containing protein, partial [Bdellovibrionales bacterium]|nr:fibronectin type III domain-containing protein [Bdellovibrionales bacterium]
MNNLMYVSGKVIESIRKVPQKLWQLSALIVMPIFLSSCGYLIEELKDLKSKSPSMPSLLVFEKPANQIYINTTTYQARWSQSVGADRYQVYVYEAPSCSGPSGSPFAWLSNVFSVSGLLDGGTYSLKVAGLNSAGTGEYSCSSDIIVDTQIPVVTFMTPAAPTSSGVLNYNFNWSGVDYGVSGLVGTDTYKVELFSQGSCAGSALVTSNQVGTSFAATGLVDGTTYSLKVIAYDNAGNSSVPVCSSNVTVSTGSAVLTLSDPTSSLTTHIRQVATSVAITNDTLATKWCLSETQTTPPASGAAVCNGGQGASSGWHSTRPITFNTSSGDGLKTIYIWIVDSGGSLLGGTVNQGITLDTTAPVVPTAQLSDPNSASTANTNQSSVNLSITADTDATGWCVIEQASGTAAPSAPAWNNACFVTTRPTAATLAATGTRRAYVYTRDVA